MDAFKKISLAIGLALSLTTMAAQGRETSPEPMSAGALAVSSAEYKFGATLDNAVLSDHKTELWARAFWPSDLASAAKSGPLPIVFLLHGNHPTCGSDSNPRIDSDCGYTYDGACAAGQVVVPNHEGYNYLAEKLASHGIVAVTINANRGITCASGGPNDYGLILARGRLVLRHIEIWKKWATSGGVPSSLKVRPNSFVSMIDFSKVGLFGHSRGGEGMRAAYNLYRDAASPWQKRIPNLGIKGIFEIGSVDGQSSRTLDADDTAWNQLLPLCDGDVSDLEGRLPFERMLARHSESRKTPKSLYMVWGANHNFFNTEWQENDSSGCFDHDPIFGNGGTSLKQQEIAIASVTSFFRAHLLGRAPSPFARHFDPLFALPSSVMSITRVDRDHVYSPDSAVSQQLDLRNSEKSDVEVEHFDDTPPFETVKWSKAGAYFQANWDPLRTGRRIDAFTSLDIRVARVGEFLVETPPADFSLQLVDTAGHASSKVIVSRYAELIRPGNPISLFQTVRIPLAEFQGVDFASIRGVRFSFDVTESATLQIASVFFSKGLLSIANALSGEQAHLPLAPSRNAPLAKRVLPVVQDAVLLNAQLIRDSKYAAGSESVALHIGAPRGFPVENSLPVLKINGQYFRGGAYLENGRVDELVFTLPKKVYDKLPQRGSMSIQYGERAPGKLWRLPEYDKAQLL